MSDDALYNRLKVLRAQRGLTQGELALAVGVSRKTINTVENRVFIPSTILAVEIGAGTGLPRVRAFRA